jgi:DNA-binding CsgD family transcriptional regulator
MARATLKVGSSGWQGRPPPAASPDTERQPVAEGASVDPALLAALDTALDAIVPPAFVVSRSGVILRANALAHALLDREGDPLRRSLATALTRGSGAADALWDLTPLRGEGASIGFLAIRRPPSRELAMADALVIAHRRWKLTARQLQVLELVARGLTNDVIAETLRIEKGTVEYHLSAIFDKAGVCNRATLIVRMYELE